jgi:hypothetical protein
MLLSLNKAQENLWAIYGPIVVKLLKTGEVLRFHTWNHFISELLVSVETFPKKVP